MAGVSFQLIVPDRHLGNFRDALREAGVLGEGLPGYEVTRRPGRSDDERSWTDEEKIALAARGVEDCHGRFFAKEGWDSFRDRYGPDVVHIERGNPRGHRGNGNSLGLDVASKMLDDSR